MKKFYVPKHYSQIKSNNIKKNYTRWPSKVYSTYSKVVYHSKLNQCNPPGHQATEKIKLYNYISRCINSISHNSKSIARAHTHTLSKLVIEGLFLTLTKSIYNNYTTAITNGKKLNACTSRMRTRQGCSPSRLLEVIASVII